MLVCFSLLISPPFPRIFQLSLLQSDFHVLFPDSIEKDTFNASRSPLNFSLFVSVGFTRHYFFNNLASITVGGLVLFF